MSQGISTHVLDTARGQPASGVPVQLLHLAEQRWEPLGASVTQADGRTRWPLQHEMLPAGTYKLKFDVADYFVKQGVSTFYPLVEVTFDVVSGQHYHIPLLLAPYGYTTYRGS